jgi:geranylgeranyl diphosphate synthase, type I
MKTKVNTDTKFFTKKLAEYKNLIDEDIAEYSKSVRNSTLQNYGLHSRVAVDAYLEILGRGGKRIRGALVLLGYEMSGGKDQKMILKAARTIEMMHAYILIIDDINDRSVVRRGGPSAHISLADYYSKHDYGSDAHHFGESIAMDAALLGSHVAQNIMANLEADAELRLSALSILNRGMMITAHGQFHDIFNQIVEGVTERNVEQVTEWKTAHYTFLNPLHIGMILAGADCDATDAITDYAMNVGRAFQLHDDILGTFGGEFEIGKSPLDDMREGKRTMLIVHSLKHSSEANKNFLLQMLGNQNITRAEFKRSKDILVQSGALEYTQNKARDYTKKAAAALNKESSRWTKDGVAFLNGLADYLLERQT